MFFQLLLLVSFFSLNTYSDEPRVDLEVVLPHQNQYKKMDTAPQPTIGPIIPLMHFSREQLWEMQHEKEYDIVYDQHKCKDWSVDDFNHAMKITQNKTNKQWFFDQWQLYKCHNYKPFLKEFYDYEDQLLSVYNRACKKYDNPGNWHKYYDEGLCHLNFIAGECKDILNRREQAQIKKKARLKYEDFIKSGYQEHSHELDEQIDDCYDALELYDANDVDSDRLDRRMQAMFVDEASRNFQEHKHHISDDVRQELLQRQINPDEYEHCYGSALQQTIHQECIDIVERTVQLNSDHPAYAYKDALIDMADGARELNRIGKTEKAMSVADVCWGILDCCSAVVEGAIEGAVGAVTDIYNNPLQMAASLAFGNYMAAYQLLKVATNLADIGITSLIDAQAGREKWDDYIAPISNVITALANKEVALRDVIKQVTKYSVQYKLQCKVQSKIVGGLGKFYSTVKTKAINYIDKNPLTTPQMYMTTPEGIMFKAVDESFQSARRSVASGKSVRSVARADQSAWVSPKQLRNAARAAEKELRESGKQSIRGLIKAAQLPSKGKIRYIPPKKFDVANGLPRGMKNGKKGFLDRFDNVWVRGESRTLGVRGFKQEWKEWDVQLDDKGIAQLGWMTRDNTHLNVSLEGRVTHK